MEKTLNINKIIVAITTFVLIISSLFVLSGCNGGNGYEPELTKTFTAGGFRIQTTSDFVKQNTDEGLRLFSAEDDKITTDDTYIYAQYDMGNEFYDFENTSLEKYTSDIVKIESFKTVTAEQIDITEKTGAFIENTLTLNMYVTNGRSYTDTHGLADNSSYIYCVGKASNAFVYIKATSKVYGDTNYDGFIKKIKAIISSTIFETPNDNNSFNNSVTSKISSTTFNSGNHMEYYGLEFLLPNDFKMYEATGNHKENNTFVTVGVDNEWDANIHFKDSLKINGIAFTENDNVRHLIKFSDSGNLGFYTKTMTNETSAEYKIYYLNQNTLCGNYIVVTVNYDDELKDLGFDKYFEQQLLVWMKNITFID